MSKTKRRIEPQRASSEVAESPTKIVKVEEKENKEETKVFGKLI